MKTKKLISFLLCLLMVFTAIPFTAYADSPTVATVRIGTNDKFTDYVLRDKQENKITPEGCTGTISARNDGSQICVYLDNFTCNLPVKILSVSNTGIPLHIEYSGNTTIAYEDTEFPYHSVRNNYSAFYVIPNVSAYLTGKDASSVFNISYIQPTEADFMQPKNALPIYTGIYTTGSLIFVGKGTVNVDVQSYITEGGNNTGDGDGCISTVGIYAGGAVYFNTSALTDASNLNVNVNAKLAPSSFNDGYVCGIQAGSFLTDASAYSMCFGGKGQMNVHTDAGEVYGNVQIWNIDARNQKILFANAHDPSIFFQGRLNLTSDCPCNKPFRKPTDPILVVPSSSYKKNVSDRELSCTYSAPEKVKLALEDGFGFYENVETAFTGTLDYKGVSGFTVLPDACFIVDYDSDKLAKEPELSFDGNKMTVKVLPCDWGCAYDAFTVRIVGYGYDTSNKAMSYAFDQIYTLWVSEAEVKEFVSVYDMGKALDLCYSNYDGYDDYHDDPLGFYDPMNSAMQVGYTGFMNGCDFKFVNDKITFTTNEDFFSTTGLKFTETEYDMFNSEFQTTEFSVKGTLPKLNIDTTFVYADHENGAKAPTVYKQRFITVKTTANAFKNYFIKNKAVSETVASGSNALGTKIIYTNAGEFGLTAKSAGTLKYEVTLTGTPTKTGKVIVVYEVTKRLLNHRIEKTRYYAEYQVLDSEPTVRNFGTAQVGTAFTKSMENPAGSISTGGSTLGKTGLKASYGVKTTISGTPTTAGEYYFITDIYLSKEAKHIYYKDVVTVTDPSKAPKITKQPENCEYFKGAPNPTFTVTASGDDLTYQWYWGDVALDSGFVGGFKVTGGKTATVTVVSNGNTIGLQAKTEFYCVVSNADGKVTTNKVKIVEITPKFTTQPKNCTVASGSKATFTAVFEKTDGVTYKWYTSDGTALNDSATAPAWTVSGSATNTLSITPKTPYAYTLSFYCEATYKGVKFKSNNAKLVEPHNCKDSLEKVAGKAVTCLLAGRKEHYKCTMCEKLYADAAATKEIEAKDTVIAAPGHNWGTGKVTKEATASTKGERTFTCANCGKTKVETFDYVKPETPVFTYGDVDCNGKIEAADARLALRGAVGLKDEGIDLVNKTSVNFLAADVDLNGKVESADARLILRFTVKLENKLGK